MCIFVNTLCKRKRKQGKGRGRKERKGKRKQGKEEEEMQRRGLPAPPLLSTTLPLLPSFVSVSSFFECVIVRETAQHRRHERQHKIDPTTTHLLPSLLSMSSLLRWCV